jgi:CO dehydrogenase nickel-insertion accessory protein CooC1
MKIAMVSYTGGAGKTTIAAQMLAPRMGNGAEIYAIESVNETAAGLGLEVDQMAAKKFRDLHKKLVLSNDAIIDVGNGSLEQFLSGMVQIDESHNEIDYFVIPVESDTKGQKETIKTIMALAEIGIEPEKIRIVFNKVESDVADEFPHVLNYVKKEKNAVADVKAAIFENELFDALGAKGTTINALLSDDTDYKASD